MDGWASHHYENDENIQSCMKKINKHQVWPNKTRTSSASENKDHVIYDEPHNSPQRRKHDLKHHKYLTTTTAGNNPSEFASRHEKGWTKPLIT